MTAIAQWPHRWFGVWKEYGPAYRNCPSVQSFVDRNMTASYNKARLRDYLTRAQIVASTSRTSFPCPFTGKRTTRAVSFRTDGKWLWLDDLPDYIDDYDVAIPTEFLSEITSHAYIPPTIDLSALGQLEWPPVEANEA
jgi:hypothetical protein